MSDQGILSLSGIGTHHSNMRIPRLKSLHSNMLFSLASPRVYNVTRGGREEGVREEGGGRKG